MKSSAAASDHQGLFDCCCCDRLRIIRQHCTKQPAERQCCTVDLRCAESEQVLQVRLPKPSRTNYCALHTPCVPAGRTLFLDFDRCRLPQACERGSALQGTSWQAVHRLASCRSRTVRPVWHHLQLLCDCLLLAGKCLPITSVISRQSVGRCKSSSRELCGMMVGSESPSGFLRWQWPTFCKWLTATKSGAAHGCPSVTWDWPFTHIADSTLDW